MKTYSTVWGLDKPKELGNDATEDGRTKDSKENNVGMHTEGAKCVN